jgi:murein DD-endopeptidase MepM/ murein hydrolase activator NlpD
MMIPRIASRASRLLLPVLLMIAGLGLSAQMTIAPFQLPMTGEPGPSSWFVIQWYGNTISAAVNAEDLYSRGQGIHFGVDFAAPCGTEVVAIGDGVVFAVDGPYGSAPHNVVIQHANGYYSLYGHLEVRPDLREEQSIKQGERVGQVGDPAGSDCVRAPHLHLEIRTDGMTRAVNPVPLIDADWRTLTVGAAGYGGGFAVDLDNPSRWQRIEDQPAVQFGDPRLNDYRNKWLLR